MSKVIDFYHKNYVYVNYDYIYQPVSGETKTIWLSGLQIVLKKYFVFQMLRE